MVNVQVYGTKVICASCVGMPSSTETFEWLQAAIGRKYEGQENKFNFEYIDFQEEQEDEDKSIRGARSRGRFILSGRSCKWRNCWRRKSSFEGCLRRNREIFIKQEAFANLQRLFIGGIDVENVVKHALPKEVEQLMEQYIVGLKEIF